MASHSDLLALFEPLSGLSADLRAEGVEIGPSAVGMWKVRDDIPAIYWPALIKIAAARGKSLTLEDLVSSQKRLASKASA